MRRTLEHSHAEQIPPPIFQQLASRPDDMMDSNYDQEDTEMELSYVPDQYLSPRRNGNIEGRTLRKGMNDGFPDRSKQLAALQASIRMIEEKRTILSALGEVLEL